MNPVEALKAEGMRDHEITYDRDMKHETDYGFVSYRMEHGLPFITHFLVYPEHRDHHNALELFRAFKQKILANGYDSFIAEVPPGREIFGKFIQACLGSKKPYAFARGSAYYLIKVGVKCEKSTQDL